MKLKQEESLDNLVDEIVGLVANSQKLADILEKVEDNEIFLKKNQDDLDKIKKRIAELENRTNNFVKTSEINFIEADRLITEKVEKIREDFEKQIINLENEIQKLNVKIEKNFKRS